MEQHTSHPSKQPPSSRRLRTAAVLVCVLALALFALWRFTRPEPAEGVKTVTVEVTHSDGAEAEFTYQTDLVYLGELLEQEGLISGSDGAYGLFVDTVDGETADYAADGGWWRLTCGGEDADTGVDSVPLEDGGVYGWIYTTG